MEPKYSRKEFEGYTHRFVVRFETGEPHSTLMDIYTNQSSYMLLDNLINEKKSDRVKSFIIEHRASKEEDELSAKFIDETLNNIR